jgi:hypothetical protein
VKNHRPVPTNSLISRRRLLRSSALGGIGLLFSGAISATTADAATSKPKKRRPTTTKRKLGSAATTTVAKTQRTDAAGFFSSKHELKVTWTIAPSEGGRYHNPYVGVWVEDSAGTPVRIVHFEYQQGKGRKWLKDMKRWSQADETLVARGKESTADTSTQATRQPGTYSVAWDGLDADGKPVPFGTYDLFVEAAREKGPYQFVKTAITISEAPFSKSGTPDGDIAMVKIELRTKA